MKKFINGKYLELSETEIKIDEEENSEILPPTNEERIEALEMAMLELAEVLANG